MHNRSVRRLAVAVLGVVAVTAAGCGDDDDGDTGTTTTVEQTDTTQAAEDGGEGAAGETIEVVAFDYGFNGLPETVAAGTKLTLVNESTEEVHELVAFPLPADEERSVEQLLQLPEEELAFLETTEPAAVLVAPPDSEGMAVVGDGTLLEPGRYAIVCFIPVGADPEEFLAAAEGSEGPPDVAGGPPHFTEGMFAELVVE